MKASNVTNGSYRVTNWRDLMEEEQRLEMTYKSCKPEILLALKDGPKTVNELSDRVGRARDTVGKVLREMIGDVHICAWDEHEAVWTLGDRPHVPRPKAFPKAKAQRVSTPYLYRPYIKGEKISWGGIPT